MPKETYRSEARKHRASLRIHADDADKVWALLRPLITSTSVVAGYWSIGKELDTQPIMQGILEMGATCAMPCIQPDSKVLKFAAWTLKTPMAQGRFNIPEPAQKTFVTPDLVLVPLLAFDRKGHRLGSGGGYYDATLADLRAQGNITAIGLAYATQACLFKLPSEPHDQRLDYVITPQSLHDFRA